MCLQWLRKQIVNMEAMLCQCQFLPAEPAGPKITLHFPCLFVYIFICALTMCTIIMACTLLP